MLLEICH